MNPMKDLVFSTRGEQSTWVPPARKILAYFHGGRIFTDTLPLLAKIALITQGLVLAFWWIGAWSSIFRDYERWRLILATLVQFGFLALLYLFARVAWMRIDHLRRIPPGESAALRSLPILLRTSAELLFFFTVAISVKTFLMPAPSPPPAFEVGGALGTGSFLGPLVSPFTGTALGVGTILSIALWSILALVVFYGLANAVETYLAIEINTRNQPGRKARHDDLVRHAAE